MSSIIVGMVKCPLCKAEGSDIIFQEVWADAYIEFEQKDDGTINKEGECIFAANPEKVRGVCLRCGRRWTIRKVFQITGLPGHPDHGSYKVSR